MFVKESFQIFRVQPMLMGELYNGEFGGRNDFSDTAKKSGVKGRIGKEFFNNFITVGNYFIDAFFLVLQSAKRVVFYFHKGFSVIGELTHIHVDEKRQYSRTKTNAKELDPSRYGDELRLAH